MHPSRPPAHKRPPVTGEWLHPHNVRRAWRAAIAGTDLAGWVTQHTARRTVGTRVSQRLGRDAARAQLGHSSVTVTETHDIEHEERAPDVRAALARGAVTRDAAVVRSELAQAEARCAALAAELTALERGA